MRGIFGVGMRWRGLRICRGGGGLGGGVGVRLLVGGCEGLRGWGGGGGRGEGRSDDADEHLICWLELPSNLRRGV